MQTIVERFIGKDDEGNAKKLWVKNPGTDKAFFSACVKVQRVTFDAMTGIFNPETFMVWLKSRDKDILLGSIDPMIAQLKNGTMVPYRVFKKTPFYAGQKPDQYAGSHELAGQEMERYSQTRLGNKATADQMNRAWLEDDSLTEEQQAVEQEAQESSVPEQA